MGITGILVGVVVGIVCTGIGTVLGMRAVIRGVKEITVEKKESPTPEERDKPAGL
jgi:hypothetical protein